MYKHVYPALKVLYIKYYKYSHFNMKINQINTLKEILIATFTFYEAAENYATLFAVLFN